MEPEHKPRPATVDGVVVRKAILTSTGLEGEILLVKRAKEPHLGEWALPGGYVSWDESASEAVVREVLEETGVKVRPIKMIGVFSDPKRDPRQTIAVAFLCEALSGTAQGGDDAEEAKWWPISRLPPLAFDHLQIVKRAVEAA